jgi:rhodanese-related sulfurtransferase
MDEYVSVEALAGELATAAAPLVIDVRGAEEYAAGHLPGAIHIPGDRVAERLPDLPAGRPVVTY